MKENEQNFDHLKQLLKLKRHEIPPPGYFHNFSSQVIAGIRDEQMEGAAGRSDVQTSWVTRFLQIFETRPGLVGGFATSLVLLLVFGVVLADRSDSDTQNIFSAEASSPSSSPLASSTISGVSASDLVVASSDSSGGIAASTNPVTSLQPTVALFGQPNSLFQSASFSPVGN